MKKDTRCIRVFEKRPSAKRQIFVRMGRGTGIKVLKNLFEKKKQKKTTSILNNVEPVVQINPMPTESVEFYYDPTILNTK